MGIDKYNDTGEDLKFGDTVYIKYKVVSKAGKLGDVQLRYLPRQGKEEYAQSSVAAVFIKRPRSRFLKNIVNWISKYV